MADLGESKTAKRRVPLEEGLFTIPSSLADKGHLIGNRCQECGYVSFPKSFRCIKCTAAELEDVLLGPMAKLDSFTVARVEPPGTIMKAPYILAQVIFTEGPVVKTIVTSDTDPASLELGMDMELVIEKVMEDKDGNDVMAYKFRPIKGKKEA